MFGQERQQGTDSAAQVGNGLAARIGQPAECVCQWAAHSRTVRVYEVLFVRLRRPAPEMSLIRHPATTMFTSLPGTTITLRTCLPSSRARTRSSASAAAFRLASLLSAGTVILLRSLPLTCTGISI